MPSSIGGSSGSGGANPATPPQEEQATQDQDDTRVTETNANGEVQPEGNTALTAEHLLTHHPKLDSCETCQRTKVNKKQRRKKENRKAREENGKLPPPAKFGEAVTMDHLVSRSDMSKGVGGARLMDSSLETSTATMWTSFRQQQGPKALSLRVSWSSKALILISALLGVRRMARPSSLTLWPTCASTTTLARPMNHRRTRTPSVQ